MEDRILNVHEWRHNFDHLWN